MHELPQRRVLIVDDEKDLRESLARLLRGQNILIELAANGKEAIECLKSQEFHCVLCDIMMPEMSGLECLSQAYSEGILTPFIFLTGYSTQNVTVQAVRLGAVDFISKPFDNNDVLDVTFRALEIGVRRNKIVKKLKITDPELLESLTKEERIISLMRVLNNTKRTS